MILSRLAKEACKFSLGPIFCQEINRFPNKVGNKVRMFSQSSILYQLSAVTHKTGNREVVGFGINGDPSYIDSVVFPYPAMRFREITPNIKALKEKEKGNWKALSIDEKKCIYRVSFCQTLAEISAPTGEWKDMWGSFFLFISAALWFYMIIMYLARDELPPSFSLESKQAQLKRMIDLRVNPITGLSSKWDYEKNKWK